MNEELLRESVELLKSIRTELHGNVEDGVICLLDKAIQDLEAAQRDSPGRYSVTDVLFLLATIIEKLPAIVKAIEYLMQLTK
jgi:hypothetical protein